MPPGNTPPRIIKWTVIGAIGLLVPPALAYCLLQLNYVPPPPEKVIIATLPSYVPPSTMPAIATPAPPPPPPIAQAPPPPTTAPAYSPSGSLDPTMLYAVHNALAEHTYQCSPVIGGAFAHVPFQDLAPSDGVLIGFNIDLGKFFNQ